MTAPAVAPLHPFTRWHLPCTRSPHPPAPPTCTLPPKQAYGPGGLGILTVRGVPGLQELRQQLLPLVARFAVRVGWRCTVTAPQPGLCQPLHHGTVALAPTLPP